jgi:hypothetical protein
MKMLAIIKKVFGYSVFDDLVECGAERIERVIPDYRFDSSPDFLWIGDFCIENGSRIYIYDDSIVVSRINGSKITRIPINKIAVNLDKTESEFSRKSRPFMFGTIKIGFGHDVDKHLAGIIK